MNLSKRPVTIDDEPFLRQLYAGTRAEEIALWNWPAQQAELFLRMQYDAQSRSYAYCYPGAEHSLLLAGDRPAGRIMVERTATVIHLVDISLLTEFRGQGNGTALLRELIEECKATGGKVVLHVLSNNLARRLYLRLGFRQVGGDGLYDEMEWNSGEAEGLELNEQRTIHRGNI
jgi:ribosomal protein S18 acetylase RimI-like enzyme